MSRTFEPQYRVAFQCGFGTGLFRGYLSLCFAEEVWHDISPKMDYVASVYNALLTALASKLKALWEAMIIEGERSDDKQTIERYGDLLGTDFNLGFQVSADVWQEMMQGDREQIIAEFEKHHALIYKVYKNYYKGNEKYGD
jgi:hypothetical protein